MKMANIYVTSNNNTTKHSTTNNTELLKLLNAIGRRMASAHNVPLALELASAATELVGAFENGDKTRIAMAKRLAMTIMHDY